MLIIIVGVVLVLLLAAGGAFFFISKQRAAADEAGEAAPAKAAAHVTKTAPVYLPLDSMVVNLADPGGEKVAQIGITLEVVDAKASDSVKAFLPTIRNGILKQISKRTSTELLTLEGKEKLAKSILREASIPFGGGEDDEDEEEVATTSTKKKPVKRRPPVAVPVEGVLFSSFIVQ
ncbi:MAG: flagellar basal body-associated FliL family protein [Rhodoferax sp.]|nr:flagellar basal body-associated FliL family protein [Rhodoferax sp.]